jgi:hypothetical protein
MSKAMKARSKQVTGSDRARPDAGMVPRARHGRNPKTKASSAATTDYLLVLTACIDPSTGPARVVRSDPDVRLADYCRALEFWLRHPDPRLRSIVFVENSGYELKTVRQLVARNNPFGKTVEFIQLNNNNYPPYVDYGYPELGMLDQVLEVSELARKSKYFIKVTGRLIFPTLTHLLDHLPADYLFSVDCRVPMLPNGKPPGVFASLMIFSRSFYQSDLIDLKSKMNEVLSNLETMLYLKLMDYIDEPGAILRWPVHISPVGHGAHWNKSYDNSRGRVVNAIRTVSRIVVPQLWV